MSSVQSGCCEFLKQVQLHPLPTQHSTTRLIHEGYKNPQAQIVITKNAIQEPVPSFDQMLEGLNFLKSRYDPSNPNLPTRHADSTASFTPLTMTYQLICAQAGFKFAENVMQERLRTKNKQEQFEVSSLSDMRRKEQNSRFVSSCSFMSIELRTYEHMTI